MSCEVLLQSSNHIEQERRAFRLLYIIVSYPHSAEIILKDEEYREAFLKSRRPVLYLVYIANSRSRHNSAQIILADAEYVNIILASPDGEKILQKITEEVAPSLTQRIGHLSM